MNFAISLLFLCFIINSTNICNANIIDHLIDRSIIDRSLIDDSVQHDLSDKDKFNIHHAFVPENFKWKNGVVFYKIDNDFNQKEIDEIKRAMNEIENSTCIRFEVHLESHGPNYVIIKKNSSQKNWWCGFVGLGFHNAGEQVVWLSQRCIYMRNILDLLLSTLGFDNHQNRSDRDNYITIHPENMVSEEVGNNFSNFVKLIDFDESFTYLTPFDFSSIMLFDEYDMSKNRKPVITPKSEGVKMQSLPNNSTLSKFDKILLNYFYECN